ncbi:MAG TPA: bifunctional diaminohydroxyphosphoribosylaminopyrimidine deaminase/5-amino-6-(5-phosphoribosylamino)uracil reductase RibD [Candidatus Krumholzibacteria bacterium]|nr:bifunctional diaminohydroxyphosphoribosylaminopyrimidine deaminase/5-amino-6-(5-phosphoribosylamino)uracil reductase RibD [Candidatus Krumholzibacteria bacterium]
MHCDEHWMRRALTLAARRAGGTWPNPAVGAVLVREGEVVGEGAHEKAGSAHAEVEALRRAAEKARGSTLYVSLEPCHHTGRTPPCSKALLEAGVSRVVYALADRNPRVRGGGGDWLRSQGIAVEEGLMAKGAWELNHAFFETEGGARAHLTVKIAMSLDGRMARANRPLKDPGQRRITGESAHRMVHRMRARASVILVGRRTALWDRPALDVRGVPTLRQPRRAVIDPHLSLLPDQLGSGHAPWLIFCTKDAIEERGEPLRAAGNELVACNAGPNGELEGKEILQHLHQMGLGQVMLEGGWTTATHFISKGLVDRLHLFCAPVLLGGDGGGPALWAGAESRWESYLLRRRGEDSEWILRKRGLPRI